MTTQAPQVLSRRGNAGRPRTSNESAKPKEGNNAIGRGGRDMAFNDKTGETAKSETTKPTRTKAQNEGEKLVLRRLPPGMTQAELMSVLGPEWDVNMGKVDWLHYSPGKVSKDPSKPSRPSRAYFHLAKKDDIMLLGDHVRSSTWEDAKNTFTDPALVAPPSVEFAIYKKVPSNKKRTDARQGTIDQDPQFMAFLENLANPALVNHADADSGEDEKIEAKVTTTPLIEYLKEKKANKSKEASGKSAKTTKSDSKGKTGSKDDESVKKKGRAAKEDKVEKPKETVKILTKKAATEQAVDAAKNAASQINAAGADLPKSRRAGIAAAARLLQRDLGLSPGSAHRRARQDAAKVDADPKAPNGKDTTPTAASGSSVATDRAAFPAPAESSQASKSTPAPSAKSQSGRRNRGGKNADKGKTPEASSSQPTVPLNPPVILKKKPDNEASQPTTNTTNEEQSSASKSSRPASKAKQIPAQKKSAAVSADATRAFVKHANPSQGVTEALLKQALEAFGTVSYVELDKRKGFAYIDFSNNDGLTKAISASPVTVGQANVQVLERKDKKATPTAAGSSAASFEKGEKPSSGRGRRGRGGGGGNKGGEKIQASAPPANAGG